MPRSKGIKMVQQLEIATGISLEKDDVESLFPLDEEAGPVSIAALEVLTDLDSDFSKLEFDSFYMAAEVTREVNPVNFIPHVSVSIYSSKYAKPIEVIAFLDIGAAQIIMNLEVFSKDCCKPSQARCS
ncbi:hypothetical protein CRG98_047324 [Punica granatum]|uniref:Uncharacterized protein n=1 Tax=Punica granatum TaxID=22663 RepID=A0A2I0HKQ4_PUNGR|nr:hypothetical protein CRG98_047324 [Punica granatum]